MNASFLLKKTPIAFLLLFCFVISFNYAEAETSIRLRKVKTRIAPRHIYLSARSGNGIYAKKYAYGRPIPNYSTDRKLKKNRRSYAGRNGNRRRGNTSRTYASRYRNWTPNGNFHGGRNNPRVDKIGQKKRKELYPFLTEPPVGNNKQKKRFRPHRFNAMQRPQPPKKTNEFDDDYFFPEEAKRAEVKYEYESRYPRPKKKRRPEFEHSYKKPDFDSKIPFYDDKPLSYKSNTREPPFSYSSFVQHPLGSSSDDSEDFYEDSEENYPKFFVRNKKRKKVKKKKKNKEQFKPFVFESDQASESYPPYLTPDEYELPTKRYKKRNKPTYDAIDNGGEFIPSKTSLYSKPKPQVQSFFNTDSDYRGSQNTQLSSHFSPSYSQAWPQQSLIETTARPLQYQNENGFQPQYVSNQYNYNKDYSNLQNTKTVTTNAQQSTYFSQPDYSYKNIAHNNNYLSNQASGAHSHTPGNYNTYSNNVYSSQSTYSQPVPSSASVLTDVTIQKSVPIYDNTETFYNYNNNAYVNSQISKYQSADGGTKYQENGQNYGNRLSSTNTSYKSNANEKTDSDSEFIKKHQNLYNNGLSGVPIQGDGFAKENVKKDYDIGYGDFQFDENPSS